MTLAFDDILAAQARLQGHIERTPCRKSRTLSEITGAEVWVKFENLQFTAAYKERGALNKLLQLGENVRGRGVIAASAGNHSQGLAYHAARLGIPVTIVMPKGTPFMKVQQTRAHGAEVLIDGDSYDEAAARARSVCDERELTFVHPFDDLDVMAGQGTVALEMLEDVPDLEVLPIPIGGGGLIAGMATAAKHLNPAIRIVGLEPAIIPSFTAKMRGVRTAQNGGASTIAEGIAVKEVGAQTYAIARPLIDEVLLIEEPYFERGIALYCNVEKTVAEGAGAAGLAALLAYPDKFRGKKCGLVITGGNIDTRLLASVLTRELVRESRIVSLRIIGDDRPGLLANVSAIIGNMGANIIEVAHNRLALDVPAKGAEFDVMIETRDAQHTQEVMDALADEDTLPAVVEGRGLVVAAGALALAACTPKAKPQAEAADPTKQPQSAQSKAFMDKIAKEAGVKVLPSGLAYKVDHPGPGTGLKPQAGDEVKVHYEGKLEDGTVFDSSYERGQPAAMPLKDLVPGWMEALPLMRPGDAWTLYVPSNLGYGEQGQGPIPPGAPLIFRIELIDVLPRPGRIQQG